ncbi:MAG: DUF4190 domain-containing protein [Candidatus Saccharibacteria bacterium]
MTENKPLKATTTIKKAPQPIIKVDYSGLGIAGMVLGIVGILSFWFGLGLVLGIVGIFLSVAGMKRSIHQGMAIAGLVTSICAIALSLPIILMITLIAYSGIQTRANDTELTTYATSIQKLAEAYNAEHGTYPSYQQMVTAAPSWGVGRDTLDHVGASGSIKDVIYIPCYGKGALITYYDSTSSSAHDIQAGDTQNCDFTQPK